MVFKEYKGLDLPAISSEILNFWEEEQIFEKSISERENRPPYIFYEGPPSANGIPGYSPRHGANHQRYFLPLQNSKGLSG
jgi:isoleucyl-tRNA synthetase